MRSHRTCSSDNLRLPRRTSVGSPTSRTSYIDSDWCAASAGFPTVQPGARPVGAPQVIDHGSGGYPASHTGHLLSHQWTEESQQVNTPARHPPERWPGMHRNRGPACSGTMAQHQPDYAVGNLRMAVAAKYLRNTKMPSQSIAALLGYSDAANFHRAFRKSYGDTPEGYRHRVDATAGGDLALPSKNPLPG